MAVLVSNYFLALFFGTIFGMLAAGVVGLVKKVGR